MPSEARLENFMTWVGEKYINCETGNTEFSLMSQSMSSKLKFTFKNKFKKSALELYSCYQKCRL